jgi:secondary thiamine-phosphate synthase enzyme
MASVIFHFATVEVDLNTGPDIRNITDDLNRIIGRSGIEKGQATACIVGSTGSLTTIEYEPGVVQDLKDAINRLAPQDLAYAHELAWHDGNGHSHVQAALLGPSVALPIRRARLMLGTWQQVVAVNHDNRSRRRTVEVTLSGV